MDYEAMGARIRALRKRNGLTQAQLAEAVHISTSFMGHIERGTRIASLDTLVRLSQVLDVLKETPGIGVTHFAAKDVVRHPLVQRIIEAYDEFESQQEVTERARREARQQEREARMLALERQGNRTGGGDQ